MNDEPNLDLWLRASAYLDGQLDAAEQARAEADPDVMAEVEQLQALQDDLRAVQPPTGVARHSAIAAALREFDAIHPAPYRTTYDDVRPMRSARSWSSLLGAVAAAVVIIAALGFVVSNGLGGSDDDADFAAGDASGTTAAGADDAGGTSRALDQSQISAAAEVASAEAADAAAEEAPTMAAAPAADAPAEQSGATVLTASEATTAPAATDAGFQFMPDQPIAGEQQLAVAGDQLVEQQRSGQLVNTPESRCGTDNEARPLEVLAEGFYTDAAGVTVPVLIAVDPATGDTLALDPQSCAPIAIAAGP